MWMSKIVELSILEAMKGLNVTFRASRVDDETANPVEHQRYPAMTIRSFGGTKQNNVDGFYNVPCQVQLVTQTIDDEKAMILTGLEEAFRNIIDVSLTMQEAWEAVRDESTWYYKSVIDIDGTPVEFDGTKQFITYTMIFKVCGSITA